MAAKKTGKTLIIVESPAKAKTISQFLGPEYRVESSYGHVRDLPQSAKDIPSRLRERSWTRLGVNVDEGFEPLYIVPDDKKKHVDRLKDALKQADNLLLATDEDREGESISWHVLQVLKPDKTMPIGRIVFHEVTPEAIQEALRNPRSVDEDLVRAQEARRILDRLYGYSLSPLLWKRVRPGLSAGRVQSVAVRMLIERERERIAFVTSSYWDLEAELEVADGRFKAKLQKVGNQRVADGKSFDPQNGKLADKNRYLLLQDEAEAFVAAARGTRPWQVSALEKVPGQQKPAPPFTTSTLQQEGNRKLRFSSRRTMDIAQQLYEGVDLQGERIGLITYMRTDSLTLSERALEQARQVIVAAYGAEYLPPGPIRYKTKAKRAQEAHEAIRPTDLARRPQDVRPFLTPEQARLYELIWKRTIASQMPPAELERTTAEIAVEIAGGKKLFFGASGRRIAFPGFLRAYVEGADDPDAELDDQESLLPALALGQETRLEKLQALGHETRPPYRYTEASLVKKLEEEGIGRPSTYASILSTIQDRGYVQKRGNELIPTFTAFAVNMLLEKQFADLVDPTFTASMEDDLDEVAAGKSSWDALVREFYLGDAGQLGLAQRVEESEVEYPSLLLGNDPASGETVEVKIGKYGPYVRRGEGGTDNVATIPDSVAPDELDLAAAVQLLKSKGSEKEALARDAATGRGIFLQKGRFGDYLELEQSDEEKEAGDKPRRVSLPPDVKPEQVTPEIARKLMLLPRQVGHDAEGREVSAAIGRFGPYVKRGDDFRSVPSWQDACDISLADAIALLDKPKESRRGQTREKAVLAELGSFEGAAGPVQVLSGRYGPYVSDGETHASLPKGKDPASVGIEEAQALIEARRSSAPAAKRKGRAAAAKAAPKKAAPKAAKKAAPKKAAAKKPAKTPAKPSAKK
jgi:DNA topoisomerase-1